MIFLLNRGAMSQDTLGFFEPAPEYIKQRGVIVGVSVTSAYALSMAGLYSLWYKDYPASDFHFFNDNNEWLQIDKAGHFGSAYYLSKWGMDLFRWTGMKKEKAIVLGGSAGLLFLTSIEIFDGFSEQWGFSTGDMIANVGGSALAVSQQYFWDEQRIKVKFSFHTTEYSKYRPDLLGESFVERLFKDYNGQTYWLSGNIHSFLSKDSKFPRWLNISFGYGAEGMTGGDSNPGDISQDLPEFERYRQFYFAPDIDLTKIPVRSKVLGAVFDVFGFVKFPAPTLELNGKGNLKFHWIYF